MEQADPEQLPEQPHACSSPSPASRAEKLISLSSAPNPCPSAQVLFITHFPHFYIGILLVSALGICSKDSDGAKDDPTCIQWHFCALSLPWHEFPLAAHPFEPAKQGSGIQWKTWSDYSLSSFQQWEGKSLERSWNSPYLLGISKVFHNFSCFRWFWCIFLYHFVVSWFQNLSRCFMMLLLQYNKAIEIFTYMNKRLWSWFREI